MRQKLIESIMPILLKNKLIELIIDLPDENYQFSRFDRTGKITSLKYGTTYLSSSEKKSQNDLDPFGKGFYSEFGLDNALGFSETLEGGWFHKIGVGLLKKKGNIYDFQKTYEVLPAVFKMTHLNAEATFTCTAPITNGYAYVLTKKIVLLENGFKISYQLHNTGNKLINTNEYSHNFLAIDITSSARYSLKLPFPIEPSVFKEYINPGGFLNVKNNQISLSKGLKETFYLSNLSGSNSVRSTWVFKDYKNKISISEHGNFKTSLVNLWGQAHVISPELFIAIEVAPKDSFSWQRVFTIEKFQ